MGEVDEYFNSNDINSFALFTIPHPPSISHSGALHHNQDAEFALKDIWSHLDEYRLYISVMAISSAHEGTSPTVLRLTRCKVNYV